MSGDARMFARERIYRYTNVYIIKVGVITSFVSPDVKSTTPSQHVRRYDCFPAIFIKSGVWLAKRDIRTPRSPHRFHGALQLNVADGSWLAGNDKKGWQCVNVARLSVCVCFQGEGPNFPCITSWMVFLVERSFFPWSSCSHASHPWVVFLIKRFNSWGEGGQKWEEKSRERGCFEGLGVGTQDGSGFAGLEALYGIWTTLMSKGKKKLGVETQK